MIVALGITGLSMAFYGIFSYRIQFVLTGFGLFGVAAWLG